MSTPDLQQIASLLQRQQEDINLIKKILVPLAVKRRTRSQQSKATGVSRTTLWRYEKRAEREAMLNGLHRIPPRKRSAA
jgi:hypothetical protein